MDRHRVTDHVVTGIMALHPVKPPTGEARLTAILVISPPSLAYHAASTASDSSVTAFATSRPPAGSAARHDSTTPSAVTPPPMNTADGAGRSTRAPGARPVTTRRPGTPRAEAFRVMRAARSPEDSTAMARQERWLRIHSIAMLPEPAPTSHSSSPGSGAS